MKKIIFIAVLILLIIFLIFFWLLHHKPQNNISVDHSFDNTNSIFNQNLNSKHLKSSPDVTDTPSLAFSTNVSDSQLLQNELPYKSNDFSLIYSPDLKKFILTKKTAYADTAFKSWNKNKNFEDLFLKNPSLFIVRDESKIPIVTINEAIASLPPQQQEILKNLKNTRTVGNSFLVDYSKELDTFFIQKKTNQADADITQWATDQKVENIINNNGIFVKSANPSDLIIKKIVDQNEAIPNSEAPITPFIHRAFTFLKTLDDLIPTGPTLQKLVKVTNTPIPLPTQSNISSPANNTNILALIQSYGLPPPTANFYNGANGYVNLKEKLSSNPKAGWSAKALLNGERTFEQKGGTIHKYLTTAWVWEENGASKYSDVYEINCVNVNDSRNQTSRICDSSNFQIAGYRAVERSSDYQRFYKQIYGSTEISSIMQEVVDNSNNASSSNWSYLDPSQQNGLVAKYLQGNKVPSTITISDISPQGKGFFDEKTQFYTLLIGKDPAMVAALNSIAVSDDNLIQAIKKPGCIYNYICDTGRQLLSNMIAALYLYDSNSSTLASPTTSQSSNNNIPNLGTGGLIYYAQCESPYASYPLPGNTNMCESGCGPSAVGMILSSYINKSFDPITVVKRFYQGKISDQGSSIYDAADALKSQGLNVNDSIIGFYGQGDGISKETAAKKMLNWSKGGWTFLVLADYYYPGYCSGGCGHFIWVTNVDDSENIWAYDSYYGRKSTPPLLENKYTLKFRGIIPIKKL